MIKGNSAYQAHHNGDGSRRADDFDSAESSNISKDLLIDVAGTVAPGSAAASADHQIQMRIAPGKSQWR